MLDKAQEPSNDVDLKERWTVSIDCSKSWILAPFLQHLLSCHQPRDCDCDPLARNKRHFCLFYVVCELELPCEFGVSPQFFPNILICKGSASQSLGHFCISGDTSNSDSDCVKSQNQGIEHFWHSCK